MLNVVCLAIAVIVCSLSGAFACQSPKNADRIYDIPNADFSAVIRARLKKIGVEHFQNRSCVFLEYEDAELLAGHAKGPYQTAFCQPGRVEAKELESHLNDGSVNYNDIFGFVPGSEVVAFLTKQTLNVDAEKHYQPPEGYFRQILFNCWGVFQINLNNMGLEERTEYLSDVRQNALKDWFEN